jgi:putative intracellular protease/amidase
MAFSLKASRLGRFVTGLDASGGGGSQWTTDIGNAGGKWIDQEVVVDRGLITSRSPKDLSAFCAKLVEEFADERHAGQASDRTARETL